MYFCYNYNRENMLHQYNRSGILTADLSTGLGKGSIRIIGGFGRFSTSTADILLTHQ